MLLYYPHKNEQQAIAGFLASVQTEIAEMRTTEDRDSILLDNMEQVILAQAFRGEL